MNEAPKDSQPFEAPSARKLRRDERQHLRFPGRLATMSQPIDCLQIDEALDQLGRFRFPGEWEKTPSHYLLSRSTARKMKTLRLREGRGGELRVVERPYLPHDRFRERLRARQIFRRVAHELRTVLERGHVEAVKFRPFTGALSAIKEPAIFSGQSVNIFFLGVVEEKQRNGPRVVRRVLIKKDPFDRWMRQLREGTPLGQHPADDQVQIPKHLTTKTVNIVARALPGIAAQLRKMGRNIRRKQLKKVVAKGIPGGHANLTREVFYRDIWHNQAIADVIMGRGHPKGENKELDNKEMAGLSELVGAEFKGLDSAPQAASSPAEGAAT